MASVQSIFLLILLTDYRNLNLYYLHRGSEVQVKLHWNTVYWVGILQDAQQGVISAKVPEVKAA